MTPTATEKCFLVIVMITSHAQGDAHTRGTRITRSGQHETRDERGVLTKTVGKERHHHHHHLSSSSREPHVRAAFIASPPDIRRVSGTRFISGARGGSEDAERGERPTLQDFPFLGHRARGHRGASLARAAVLNGHAREGLLDVHASPSPGGLLAGRTGGLVAHSRAGGCVTSCDAGRFVTIMCHKTSAEDGRGSCAPAGGTVFRR